MIRVLFQSWDKEKQESNKDKHRTTDVMVILRLGFPVWTLVLSWLNNPSSYNLLPEREKRLSSFGN